MFKLVLEKAEEPEIKLPTSVGSQKKQESSIKTYISALSPMPKTLTEWITINCGKFWRDGNTRLSDLPSEKLYAGQEATVRTEHGTTDWFQIGKGVCQGCILSPCLFNLYAEYIGEGNGSPLQYSCLENPMDKRSLVGYTVHGVAKSRTRLSNFTFTFTLHIH